MGILTAILITISQHYISVHYMGIKCAKEGKCQCVSALPMFAHFPTVYFQINLSRAYTNARGA